MIDLGFLEDFLNEVLTTIPALIAQLFAVIAILVEGIEGILNG